VGADLYGCRYTGISDEDDLNEAPCLTKSFYKLPNTTQPWIHYYYSDLQIQFLDKRSCLSNVQSRDRLITGFLESLTNPIDETQVVIDDQGRRPT